MIKRLIFDVDNTLITNINFKEAMEKTLKETNLYSIKNLEGFLNALYTYESIYNNYNKKDYIAHIEKNLGKKIPENFLETFFENLKTAIPPRNEKLIETIDKLSKKYELVLLTNYFAISQLNRLNNMGIGKYFIEYYGEQLIKPNLESYIMACGNNKPEECVMIGDSIYLDVECPQKAGLKAILINSKKIDTNNINTIILNKVEELTIEIIEKLN